MKYIYLSIVLKYTFWESVLYLSIIFHETYNFNFTTLMAVARLLKEGGGCYNNPYIYTTHYIHYKHFKRDRNVRNKFLF